MAVKGGTAGILAALLAFAFFISLAFILRIPEIYGVSLRWGWRGIDHGRSELRALTPKIADLGSPSIFLERGEQLDASYDLRLTSGRARMGVYTWGWVPWRGPLTWFHQDADIRAPTRRLIQVVAPANGFYRVNGAIVRATGTFTIDWTVRQPTRTGQAVRFARAALALLPLALIFALALALAVAGIRRLPIDACRPTRRAGPPCAPRSRRLPAADPMRCQ